MTTTTKKTATESTNGQAEAEEIRRMCTAMTAYGKMATAIAAAVSEALAAGVGTDQIEASCMSFACMASGWSISVDC